MRYYNVDNYLAATYDYCEKEEKKFIDNFFGRVCNGRQRLLIELTGNYKWYSNITCEDGTEIYIDNSVNLRKCSVKNDLEILLLSIIVPVLLLVCILSVLFVLHRRKVKHAEKTRNVVSNMLVDPFVSVDNEKRVELNVHESKYLFKLSYFGNDVDVEISFDQTMVRPGTSGYKRQVLIRGGYNLASIPYYTVEDISQGINYNAVHRAVISSVENSDFRDSDNSDFYFILAENKSKTEYLIHVTTSENDLFVEQVHFLDRVESHGFLGKIVMMNQRVVYGWKEEMENIIEDDRYYKY